eukprot:scaffold1298_cov98-Isochrysis_galbana.AAC.2
MLGRWLRTTVARPSRLASAASSLRHEVLSTAAASRTSERSVLSAHAGGGRLDGKTGPSATNDVGMARPWPTMRASADSQRASAACDGSRPSLAQITGAPTAWTAWMSASVSASVAGQGTCPFPPPPGALSPPTASPACSPPAC